MVAVSLGDTRLHLAEREDYFEKMIDIDRLTAAYQQARRDLLAQRVREGHWVGELSTSALSTATAASALAIIAEHTTGESRRATCRQLVRRAIEWLAQHANYDGGFGDTDKSCSNIATTLLVQAAFHLAGVAADHAELLDRAQRYVDTQGGASALQQHYGKDKTFAVPILTNCALAGLVPWKKVSPLPFELSCLPYPLLRFLRLSVVSYAVPALVAIGQARFFHRKPINPLMWLIRRLAVGRSLRTLRRMQPASGGFLEAIPLTSFVSMSLAATGRADHPVVRRGMKFLIDSVRDDGSWPIDVNLATWNTSGAINALAAATGDVGALGCLDWLLACQHRELHPLSHTAPGGWGWSDLSGAVPDADDTSAALLALVALFNSAVLASRQRIQAAAVEGVKWLLDLQNNDGGWPTFCRGWGALPFDRSGTDLTAHAIRAIASWRSVCDGDRVEKAIRRGFDYLARTQNSDGSWYPLWFGNEHNHGMKNPVYGTGRVLLAYRDLGQIGGDQARRGIQWLAANQGDDGGWGAGADPDKSSTEETAVAVETLLLGQRNPSLEPSIDRGVQWLIDAVESQRHRETAPIGFYFAKLWYYEGMYPLTFTVSALGQAVRRLTNR